MSRVHPVRAIALVLVMMYAGSLLVAEKKAEKRTSNTREEILEAPAPPVSGERKAIEVPRAPPSSDKPKKLTSAPIVRTETNTESSQEPTSAATSVPVFAGLEDVKDSQDDVELNGTEWATFDRAQLTHPLYCRGGVDANGRSMCEWHLPPSGSSIDFKPSALGVMSAVPPTLGSMDLMVHGAVWPGREVLDPAPYKYVFAASCVPRSRSQGTPANKRVAGSQSDSRDVSILFIGHSHSRYLGAMLCMMINHTDCALFKLHRRNATFILRRNERGEDQDRKQDINPIAVAWIQANFQWSKLLRRYFPDGRDVVALPTQPLLVKQQNAQSVVDADVDREQDEAEAAVGLEFTSANLPSPMEFATAQFTHIVASRGSWDMLFWDYDPAELVQEIVSEMQSVHRRFPSATVILHMPHQYHCHVPRKKPTSKSKMGSYTRQLWRAKCFQSKRVAVNRDTNLCAFYRLIQNTTADQSTQWRSTPFRMFDVYESSTLPYAVRFVDGLGHHYFDTVLEAMTMKLLHNHVCAGVKSNVTTSRKDLTAERLEILGSSACKRVEEASAVFKKEGPLELCSCHNPQFREGTICSKFGRHIR